MEEYIKKQFNDIATAMKFQYYGFKGMTNEYITKKEQNVYKIELLLDNLLNCYYFVNDAKESFDKLCDYLKTVDPAAAEDYRQIFLNDFGEDAELKRNK